MSQRELGECFVIFLNVRFLKLHCVVLGRTFLKPEIVPPIHSHTNNPFMILHKQIFFTVKYQ
jgi:hypothetical protein